MQKLALYNGKAYVASSLLEKAISLFEDKTDIIEVEDDCAYLEDTELDSKVFLKYGSKLFVRGDLIIGEEGSDIIENIEYLYVTGTVSVFEEDVEKLNKVKHEEGELVIRKRNATYISEREVVQLTMNLLENQPGEVVVEDCGVVKIEESIPDSLLKEKVVIRDCGVIKCSESQKAILQIIAEDSGIISSEREDEDSEDAEDNTVHINSSHYRF